MIIEGEYPEILRVETGLPSLDYALGSITRDGTYNYGWPMTIYEIFGSKGTGKTTFSTSIAGIIAKKLEKSIVYAPVEHVDRDYMARILQSVGYDGLVSILGGKDMVKKFMPEVKLGKDDHITDEILGDCFVEALRRDEYGVGIFDSLTAVSPIEEMESSSADKNMGRRARLSGTWVRQILQSSRFRENQMTPCTIFLTHKATSMSMYPTNTGTSTTGGEGKKNLSKVRIGIKQVPDEAWTKKECMVLEGVTEHNNFGKPKQKFNVVIIGGWGVHAGLSAVYDCKVAKLASFGKGGVKLGGESLGSLGSLIDHAINGNDSVFVPFFEAMKNPHADTVSDEEEEDGVFYDEPAE